MCYKCEKEFLEEKRYTMRPTNQYGKKYVGPLSAQDYIDLVEVTRLVESSSKGALYNAEYLQMRKDGLVQHSIERQAYIERRKQREIELYGHTVSNFSSDAKF